MCERDRKREREGIKVYMSLNCTYSVKQCLCFNFHSHFAYSKPGQKALGLSNDRELERSSIQVVSVPIRDRKSVV